MSEDQLLDAVVDLAWSLGWTVAHFGAARTEKGWRTPARANAKGFPDLVLVRERLVAAELKVRGRAVRGDQRDWLERLGIAGQEAYVWREGDWTSGEIEAVLRRNDPHGRRFRRVIESASGDLDHAARVLRVVEG